MTDENLIRVNMMLSEETLQILDDYKDLMGISRSALLRGLISEAVPNLKHLLEVLEGFDKLSEGEKAVKISRLGQVASKLDANIKKGVSLL